MIAIVMLVLALFGALSWLTFGLLLPTLFLIDTAFVWVLFLAIMHCMEARDAERPERRIDPEAVPYAMALLRFGLVADLVYNYTWANLICFDRPRGYLITQRLKLYKYGGQATPYQSRLANWFARVLLDWADPSGKHV